MPGTDLIQLIHVSDIMPGVGPDDFRDIFEASRRNNAALEITGVLCICGDRFIQVLEGPAEPVHAVLARLRTDRRHSGLLVILEAPIREREFSRWSLRIVDATTHRSGEPELPGGELPAGSASAVAVLNFLRYQAARASG